MRRKPFAVALVLLSAALVLGGNALLDAGWGSVLRSIADRVLPNHEITMWAPAPEPGSHASSYADATGAGANYVYLVDAADDRGNVRELQLIFFGRESDGEGWLEIEARGDERRLGRGAGALKGVGDGDELGLGLLGDKADVVAAHGAGADNGNADGVELRHFDSLILVAVECGKGAVLAASSKTRRTSSCCRRPSCRR